jgi:hypothetical protein
MERRPFILVPRGLASLAAITISTVGGCAEERSSMGLFSDPPTIGDTLHYSHAKHLKLDVGCLDCHKGIDVDLKPTGAHFPDHDRCQPCHETKEEASCTLCHERPELALRHVPDARGIRFSHPGHMAETRGNCMHCHADIPQSDLADKIEHPPMETCTDGCHRTALSQTRCELCHEDLSRYKLESIRFMAHGANFEHTHGRAARRDSSTCGNCHDKSYCSDCHSNTALVEAGTKLAERSTRSFIHPQPYLAIHALDSRAKKDTCESCHRPTFCRSCHASVGVAGLTNERTAPHPQGWLDPFSPSFHGIEARRSIETCAGCHDRGGQSNCVRCHQVGGSGGNPHPPGFSRRTDPNQNRMCRVCHVPGSP